MSRVYTSPRVLPLLILGFASGLPLALVSGTLQAWATVENVSLTEIGFLTLVGSAYTLKFLWAPLIDRYAPPFMGRRRGWILVTQLLLAASIAAMGLFSPSVNLTALALLAVWVAFLSATQDIAIDAWRIEVSRSAEELGKYEFHIFPGLNTLFNALANEPDFASNQRFDGNAANVGDFDVHAMLVEKFLVFRDPERQHGAADGAVSYTDRGGRSRRGESSPDGDEENDQEVAALHKHRSFLQTC